MLFKAIIRFLFFYLLPSSSMSPHQIQIPNPIPHLFIPNFQIYVMLCLSFTYSLHPVKVSHLYLLLLCLLCCTAADLHAVKSDIATRAKGVREVGAKLRRKGEPSSLYARAINPLKPDHYEPDSGSS